MSNCVLFIFFLKNFVVSILTTRFLNYLEFIFVYGVKEYSNLIIIFMAEGRFSMSSIMAIHIIPIYIPSIGGGGFPVPISSPAVIVFRVFGHGHSHWCDVIPRCRLDLHFSNK